MDNKMFYYSNGAFIVDDYADKYKSANKRKSSRKFKKNNGLLKRQQKMKFKYLKREFHIYNIARKNNPSLRIDDIEQFLENRYKLEEL